MAPHGGRFILPLLIFAQLTRSICSSPNDVSVLKDVDSQAVTIQSGRQKIHITGRDAFDGYFTKVTFPKQRCINGLTVDSLIPLTGAEDIEIIFSPCTASKTSWKLVHYRNRGAHFSLDRPVSAMEISVVSRKSLPVVDIAVESCNAMELQQSSNIQSNCDQPTITPRPAKIQHDHKLRRHQKPYLKIEGVDVKSISIKNHRMKRQAGGTITSNTTYALSSSPYSFENDWIIPPGITVVIEPGVELRFAAGTGATVQGRLIANGTVQQPIKFVSIASNGSEWRGLNFQQDFASFDVRLTMSEFGNDGFVQTFDAVSQKWRFVCGLLWANASADVVCKQLGFREGGSATPIPPFRLVEKGDFWLSSVICTGNETTIEQCSKSFAEQQCSVPPAAVLCKGVADRDADQPSVLEHVNVTESLNGITITGRVPMMNQVVSQYSQTNGFTFDVHYDPRQAFNSELIKLTAVNNRNNGIRIQIDYPIHSSGQRSEPSFTLRQTISASNRENGLIIRGNGHILVERSSFFTNTLSGIDCALSAGHAEFSDSLSASNSLYGWHVVHDSANSTERYKVSFVSCNITGHFHDAAVAIFIDNNSDLAMNSCIFWENYNGAIHFGPFSNSDVKITNSNFTRNRGRLISFDTIGGGSNMLLDQNTFSLNQLTNHSARQAVVGVRVGRVELGTTVILSNNLFYKNTMENIVTVEDNRDAPAYQLRLNIERNMFKDNLSPDILLVDVPSANVTLNRLEDPQARCELRTGPYREGTRIDATNNFWGLVAGGQIATRICDFKQQATLLPAQYVPFMTDPPGGQQNQLANLEESPVLGNAIQPIIAADDRIALSGVLRENDVRIPATGDPYRVAESVLIEQGQTLTIEPGARLEFEGGRGLRVRGKLIVQGTPENPVVMIGSTQNAWSGIVFDNQNSDQASSVEGCIIENALTGMVINSKQVHVANCRIINSILSSVEIGPQSDIVIDFGNSSLEKSLDKGIRVVRRALGITLRNVQIADSAGVALDFESPTEDITINNVKITNSGLYAVRIDQIPRFPIRSITIDGLAVTEQQRGQVGLFLNVLDYTSVTVRNSLFARNTVPSIQMQLKCNYVINSDPSVPLVIPIPTFLFEANNIIDNSNLVATFALEYCADATFRRNNFEMNNRDHRFGTLEVISEPALGQQNNFKLVLSENTFLKNEGEFTVYLLPMTQYPFQGSFDQNKLTSNNNVRSALIVGSPFFKVNLNDFVSPQSAHELEVEYNDDQVLDATSNYWGSNLPEAIARRILDGSTYATRGTVSYRPFLTRNETTSGCPNVKECSGQGICIGADQCQCDSGFTGADCSQFSCVDVSSCTENGKCSGPNSCICNAGWFGTDCSRPTCVQINDCSGHGTCVSLNECSCFPGFSGADCSIGACQNNCNSHGVCLQNGQCQCDGGWLPPFCATADCSALNQCSNAGICAAPNLCECSNGYSGLDCSQCTSGNCEHVQCDFRCVHGACDISTRTCICAIGWTGAACDICAPGGQCQSQPMLFYILPQSGPTVVDENFRVHAIGQDFPGVAEDRYICQYGTQSGEGRWVTSGLISCQVPISPTVGRQTFNLQPFGQNPLPVSESIQLTFTFYESCNRETCKGVCVGSKCLCEASQSGINCDESVDAPQIDESALNKPETTVATEGLPYSIQLTTISNSVPVIWSIIGPIGMTINPQSGMVTWTSPIGATQPYSIEATAHSIYGSSTMTWSLTVEPTYIPRIDRVGKLNEASNVVTITGHIDFASNGSSASRVIPNAPVTLSIFHNGILEKELHVIADAKGNFEEKFVPQAGTAGSYQVVASHPNVVAVTPPPTADSNSTWALPGLNVTYPNTISFSTGETPLAESSYILKNIGSTVLSDFNITIISPAPEVEIQAIQAGTRIIPANGEATVTVRFITQQQPFVPKELILLFTTIEGVTAITYQNITLQGNGPSWSANPAYIVLSSSNIKANENLELTLTNEGETSTSPLVISFPEESPLFLVASSPSLNLAKDKVVLTLGVLPNNVPLVGSMNGSITITSQNGNQLLTIPYTMRTRATELFNLMVTINDETTYLSDSKPPVNGVEVRLINPAEGFSDTRYTARNEPAIFYSIGEGMYELVMAAAGHEPLSLMIQATPTNNQLTIFLPLTIVTFLPTVNDSHLSLVAAIANDTIKQSLPALVFSPGVIVVPENSGTVLITAENQGSSAVEIPEYQLEATSGLPFSIKIPAVLSSFGPGESYEFPIQITTNTQESNQTIKCDAFLISVPYFYKLQDHSLKRFAKLIIQSKSTQPLLDFPRVCEVNQEKGTISQVPIAISTEVSCNCAVSARKKCQDSYRPTAPCGSAFSQISNITSLESLAEAMKLFSDCKLINIDLRLADNSINCALSLDKNCPSIPTVVPLQSNPNAIQPVQAIQSGPVQVVQPFINLPRQRRRRQIQTKIVSAPVASFEPDAVDSSLISTNRLGNTGPGNFFNQVSLLGNVAQSVDSSVSDLFPIFNVLDSTPANVVAAFHQLFENLWTVIGEDVPGDSEYYRRFYESVADSSPGGQRITADELTLLANHTRFALRWNRTATAWAVGQAEPAAGTQDFISFSAASQLISMVNRINEIARQNNVINPFSLLDGKLSQLLFEGNGSINEQTDRCAEATVTIRPAVIGEEQALYLTAVVKNVRSSGSLNRIRLAVAFEKGSIDSQEILFSYGQPRLEGIPSLDGAGNLQAGANFSAEWRILTNPRLRLTKNTIYEANVLLSFENSLNGQISTQRLNTAPLVFHPNPALKIFYFLYSTVSPQDTASTTRPFTVMAAIMNAGYSDFGIITLADTRLKIVSILDQKKMISYKLAGTSVDDRAIEPTFHMNIPGVVSGTTAYVRYNLTVEEAALMQDFSVAVMMDGGAVPIADMRKFFVERALPDLLLVTIDNRADVLYLYSLKTAGIAEVSQLQFWRSSDENTVIDGQTYRRHLVIFRYPDSTGRSTTVYGRTILPFDVDSDFKPVRITQMAANGSSAEREINLLNFWVTNDPDGTALHILDTDLSLPPQEATVTYEFLFGDPDTLGVDSGPKFGANTYQIDTTTRTPVRTAVGSVSATSREGSKISYKLYGGDGFFAVRPETGEIMLEKPLPLNTSRYCLTVAAVDEQGRRQLVPVTIRLQDLPQNANNPQCNVLPNVDTQPAYIHVDDDNEGSTATTRGSLSSAATTLASATTANTLSSASSASMLTTSTTSATLTTNSGSVIDNPVTTVLPFSTTNSPPPSEQTTSAAVSTATSAFTATTSTRESSEALTTASASSAVSSATATSAAVSTSLSANTGTTSPTPSSGMTTSANSTLPNTFSTTTVARNDRTTTTSGLNTGGQVDQPSGSSAPDVQPPPTSPSNPSLDEKKLMEMACKLKDTKPIWGIICDLSKTTQNN